MVESEDDELKHEFPAQVNFYFWLNDMLNLFGEGKYSDAQALLERWHQNPGLASVSRWEEEKHDRQVSLEDNQGRGGRCLTAYATAMCAHVAEFQSNMGQVGVECTEADVSWAVLSLPGKGRTTVATRDIAAGETIIAQRPLALQRFLKKETSSLQCPQCLRTTAGINAHWQQLPELKRWPLPDHIGTALACSGFGLEPESLEPCACGVIFCSTSCKHRALAGQHGLLCKARLSTDQQEAYEEILRISAESGNCHILLAVHIAAEIIAKACAAGATTTLSEIIEEHYGVYVSKSWEAGDEGRQQIVEALSLLAERLFLPFCSAFPEAGEIRRRLLSPAALGLSVGMLSLVCVQASFLSPHALGLRLASKGQETSGDGAMQSVASFASTSTGRRLSKPVEASALVPFVAFCNHSCIPNMEVDFNHEVGAEGIWCTVTTSRAVSAGEELTMEYIPVVAMPYAERQLALSKQWGFTCECTRCIAEHSLSAEDAAWLCRGCEAFRDWDDDSCCESE
eukprot:TRINITY_DN38149_c0_g1_i1.p1 TRINITY_DN38149_c0_g1~~TRINITY_DN38149_c0_g1_i1.p1  ORF type:complete len:512 (-),score=101.78 TRINITY_DN38149_c0_g1_i1:148-1683(-)